MTKRRNSALTVIKLAMASIVIGIALSFSSGSFDKTISQDHASQILFQLPSTQINKVGYFEYLVSKYWDLKLHTSRKPPAYIVPPIPPRICKKMRLTRQPILHRKESYIWLELKEFVFKQIQIVEATTILRQQHLRPLLI